MTAKPIYPISQHAYNMRRVAERDALARKERYTFDRRGSGSVQLSNGEYLHFAGPLNADRQFYSSTVEVAS